MRRTRLFFLILVGLLCVCSSLTAQENIIERINEYGKFDNWCVREIKESGIIGGHTKYLYEFYGDQDTLRTGKQPYQSPEGYPWRTNNVLAIVAGVVKTNNTIFPEPRDSGYCARIETHIEEVKAMGMVNMDVVCQGVLLVGELPEPIKDTKSPLAKVFYGVSIEGCPKALRFDYKADLGYPVVRGTGFSKMKMLDYPDSAEVTFVLQKRWEDAEGRIHALRVGTAIQRLHESVSEWVNGYEMPLHYGDITSEPFYEDYMGLKVGDGVEYYALNSKGKNVVVEEEGWAEPGTEPNHMMIHFIASCGKAFYGGVGNTLWIDNVEVIM